ncbi:hypothetical protein C6401_07970 [Arthrobacter woluwensis]|nr:hypothetical protein C6401_07970 [Arthrobacter woluwensis]
MPRARESIPEPRTVRLATSITRSRSPSATAHPAIPARSTASTASAATRERVGRASWCLDMMPPGS